MTFRLTKIMVTSRIYMQCLSSTTRKRCPQTGRRSNNSKKPETQRQFVEFVRSFLQVENATPSDEQCKKRNGSRLDRIRTQFNERQMKYIQDGEQRETISRGTTQSWYRMYFLDSSPTQSAHDQHAHGEPREYTQGTSSSRHNSRDSSTSVPSIYSTSSLPTQHPPSRPRPTMPTYPLPHAHPHPQCPPSFAASPYAHSPAHIIATPDLSAASPTVYHHATTAVRSYGGQTYTISVQPLQQHQPHFIASPPTSLSGSSSRYTPYGVPPTPSPPSRPLENHDNHEQPPNRWPTTRISG
jgi:hypothetical protein